MLILIFSKNGFEGREKFNFYQFCLQFGLKFSKSNYLSTYLI